MQKAPSSLKLYFYGSIFSLCMHFGIFLKIDSPVANITYAQPTTNRLKVLAISSNKAPQKSTERPKPLPISPLSAQKSPPARTKKRVVTITKSQRYLIKRVPPNYPFLARKRALQGIVRLKILVDELGVPLKIIKVASSGHTILDQAAIKAVRNWRFSTAKSRDWLEQEIEFKLKEAH